MSVKKIDRKNLYTVVYVIFPDNIIFPEETIFKDLICFFPVCSIICHAWKSRKDDFRLASKWKIFGLENRGHANELSVIQLVLACQTCYRTYFMSKKTIVCRKPSMELMM
jgi:hypothetical protein